MKKGFTILEVIVSLAILTIGATAVVTILDSFSTQIRNTEVKSGFEGALTLALDEATRMLINTEDPTTKNLTQGICSFMKTYQNEPGLGFIYVELPVADPFKDETKKWGWGSTARTSVFPPASWDSKECTVKELGFQNISNVWQRCFVPKNLDTSPPFSLPIGLKNNPLVRVLITPVRIRVAGQIDSKGNHISSDDFKGYQQVTLPKVEQDKLDARDTAFLLTAEISYQKSDTDLTRVTQRLSILKWFGEFQCHKVISSTKKLIMRPSGFGSGDDSVSLFSANEKTDQTVFDVKQRVRVFTEGTVTQERAVTLLNSENLASSGCQEKQVFNCKFKNKDASFWRDDSLLAVMNIKYNSNNSVTKGGSSLFVKPSLSLRNGDTEKNINVDSDFYLNNDPNQSVNNGISLTTTSLDIYSKAKAPTSVCTKVCSPANNYNQNESPYLLNYGLYADSLKQTFDVGDSKSKFACICCYAKQCSAIGTKVQSWCSAQPDEALDSRIPECAADYNNPATVSGLKDRGSLKDSQTNKVLNVELSDPNANCLVGTKSSQNLTVSSESCESKHRVLCYSQGRFILSPKEFTRKEASQACYDLSVESVLTNEIDERMVSQIESTIQEEYARTYKSLDPKAAWDKLKAVNLPPPKNGRYVFRNAALAGIFISPQEDVQLRAVVASSEIPNSTKFWIALRTNEKADLVSAVPLIPSVISPYISHFDGFGSLYFLKEDNVCTTANPGDCLPYKAIEMNGPVVVQHARTRFGAAIVDPTKITLPFAALCLNPTTQTFFRSQNKVSDQKAAMILCLKEKGVLVAPVRPLQWIASLMTAKETFNQLPFPVYKKEETLADGILWTGLVSKANSFEQILPEKPTDSCLVNGEFQKIVFDEKTQSPEPKFHFERSGGVLTLVSGPMSSEATEEWIQSDEDFISISKAIFDKIPSNIQFKKCPDMPPAVCGSANGVAVANAPTTNLCSVGTASSVNGTGPWTWTCQSVGSSPAASCSAPTTNAASSSTVSATSSSKQDYIININVDTQTLDVEKELKAQGWNGDVLTVKSIKIKLNGKKLGYCLNGKAPTADRIFNWGSFYPATIKTNSIAVSLDVLKDLSSVLVLAKDETFPGTVNSYGNFLLITGGGIAGAYFMNIAGGSLNIDGDCSNWSKY